MQISPTHDEVPKQVSGFSLFERLDSGFKSKLEAGLGIDSMQGMRDAKTIIGTTGLSENLGQNDGIRKHHWGLSMECLW